MPVSSHHSPLLLLLALGLSACLPDLKDDTAACAGPEICNGEDDDCDGSVDENATDAPAWYPDGDGDGYGDPTTSTLSCEQPTGFVSEDKATGANADCDDGDDDIYPGAADTWYDGVDSDCAGDSDYDQDGDGHDHDAFSGDDCDDEDADSYPGQSEVWYDGIDQDCDGLSDNDQDGDGHDDWEHGGDDCDDLADDVYPGADELWYDGVDQNCDGLSDYDQDYDGYDSEAYSGTDCDDTEASTNPGAVDTWYDGIDSDCAGDSDYDQDGDGYDYTGTTGGDCDDEQPAAYPYALEWADGVDNDCDGITDEFTLDGAPVVLEGETGGDYAGCSVAGVGDVNNDGFDDLLIGAYGNDDGAHDGGAAYLVYGPASSMDLSGAAAQFSGWLPSSSAGYAVAGAGDVNSDGYADLLVGAPLEGTEGSSDAYSGAAYVVYGPASGDMDLDSADVQLRAVSYFDGAGWSLDGGEDVTGDGVPDLLLGATDLSEDGSTYLGGAHLVDGTTTGTLSLTFATATLLGGQASANAGAAVTTVPDMDGDGIGEVLIGAPMFDETDSDDTEFPNIGRAYLLRGPITGSIYLEDDADISFRGEQQGHRAGDCVTGPGDITGDGYGDILIGASQAGNGSLQGPGRVYLVQGPFLKGNGYLGYSSTAIFQGPSDDNSAALCSSDAAGDMDGDGTQDVILGAYSYDNPGEDAGSAWLHLGPFGGTIDASSAAAVFWGADDDGYAGVSVAGAGDTNADGYPDLLIGAPYADTTGIYAGAAYLLLGSPLP